MRKVVALLSLLALTGCGNHSADDGNTLEGRVTRALQSLYLGDGRAFYKMMDPDGSLDGDMERRVRDMLHFRREYERRQHGGVVRVELTDLSVMADSTADVYFRLHYADQSSLPGTYHLAKKGASWVIVVRE